MDGIAEAQLLSDTDKAQCPACHEYWPLDRFNGKHPECFRCRSKTVGVAWGSAGKAFWHGTTTKEYRDKTIAQATANGLDPVPVQSASVAVAGSAIKKLESSSGVKGA